MIEMLQEAWALRALMAAMMVGTLCGLLGVFVVLRNMSLIGDALSHAVLPGVVAGFVVFGAGASAGMFLGAVVAGLLTAVIITWIQQNVQTKPDAAIGIVFTAMFSLGVMGISKLSKNYGVHLDLKDFLFGNVLGVSNEDLWVSAAILGYVILSVVVFYRFLFAVSFQPVVAKTMGISVNAVHYFLMLLLSFAVVASLQTVGVILVVSLLITPAATALLLSHRLPMVLVMSSCLGALAALLGFCGAIYFETTPGPAIAITSTMFYVTAVIFSPSKGLLFAFLKKRSHHERIRMEDTLKQALKLHEKDALTVQALADILQIKASSLQTQLPILQRRGFILKDGQSLSLTSKGVRAATHLVRAHRLWETFLVEHHGLTGDQIHESAEKYEHWLTDELLDEVEQLLGYPDVDPHGSAIPKKE